MLNDLEDAWFSSVFSVRNNATLSQHGALRLLKMKPQLYFSHTSLWECKGFVSRSHLETIWRVWVWGGAFSPSSSVDGLSDRMSSGTNRSLPANFPYTRSMKNRPGILGDLSSLFQVFYGNVSIEQLESSLFSELGELVN